MMVRWTGRAAELWEQAFDYIAAENDAAAHRIAGQIIDITDMLAAHPHAGRIGRSRNTREFLIPGTSFILVYGVDVSADVLWVYAVYHGCRRWPRSFPRK